MVQLNSPGNECDGNVPAAEEPAELPYFRQSALLDLPTLRPLTAMPAMPPSLSLTMQDAVENAEGYGSKTHMASA